MPPDARSVSVRLRAEVSGYVAGLAQAATATRGLAAEAAKTSAAHRKASQEIGRSSAIGGAALLGIAAIAVKTEADFDKAMSGVRAATHETATNMGLLREAAIQAGADTAFSASEAADAEKELAKAGVATSDILRGGLKGALNLAAAGQLDVGQAAEIAATSMTQFGLAGKDIPHIADLLAAGAGKAQGEVSDMALAMKYAGVPASALGVSIEETAGTIALFAKNGIVGEQAGTSLRSMIASLTSPSQQAAKMMSSLGISVFDAQGNFIGFNGVAGQLNARLGQATQAVRAHALGVIFGNEALQAANVLTREGAAGVNEWTSNVNDQAYAATSAAIQLDNLAGDIEKFSGSMQTALIDSGTAGNGLARSAVQDATSVVNAYSALPGPVQEGVTALVAVTGAAAAAGGGLLILIPKVAATRTALADLGVTSARTNATLAAVGKGFALIAIAEGANIAAEEIGKLGASHVQVDQLSASLLQTAKNGQLSGAALALFDEGFGPFTNHATSSSEALNRFANNAELALGSGLNQKLGRLQDMGVTTSQFREEVGQLDSALAALAASGKTTEAAAAFDQLMRSSGLTGDQLTKLTTMFPLYNAAASTAAESSTSVAASVEVISPAVQDATTEIKKYTDALNDTAAIDAYTANANLTKSFRDLSKSLKDGGKVTNDEKISLGGFASDVRRTASAVFDQTGSQDKANASMARGKRHFIDLATQAGYSAKAARRLADDLLAIPARTDVTVDANTARARAQVTALIHSIQSSGATLPVSIGVANKVTAGGPKHAAGGFIAGPGTATSDTIPAWLSNGEYVVKAAAVAKYGRHFFDEANAMHFAAGGQAKKPSAADRASARRDTAGAAAAAATAARVGEVVGRTPETDSVADIVAAIAAVKRLTDAYAAQQAVVGMNRVQRRKYHAEQRTQAMQERLDVRKTAAEAREAAAKTLADNQSAWEFDHLSQVQQLAALDKRIAGEKKYSDAWVADSKQREQIAAEMAATEAAAADAAQKAAEERLSQIKQALDAAIQERDQKIAAVAGVFTSYGSIGQGLSLPGAQGEVTGAQVGGTDVLTGGLIAASESAKVGAARTFVANLRRLRALGLNGDALHEILDMGIAGGSAYAAALVADSSVLGSINADQAEFAALGASLGAEFAGPVRYMTGPPASGPTTFNIFDVNGVLMGTMYGAADQVAGDIASLGWYGRTG